MTLVVALPMRPVQREAFRDYKHLYATIANQWRAKLIDPLLAHTTRSTRYGHIEPWPINHFCKPLICEPLHIVKGHLKKLDEKAWEGRLVSYSRNRHTYVLNSIAQIPVACVRHKTTTFIEALPPSHPTINYVFEIPEETNTPRTKYLM